MTTESCREWRTSLGAYVLGQLPDEERAGLEAHLEGCPECRAEAESLGTVARLMPLADPARITEQAPHPPDQLRERIEGVIGAEHEGRRKQRRRRRFGFAFGGIAAAAAAAIAIVVTGGGEQAPEQHIAFHDVPKGIEINATLQPHAYGTEIKMYVSGVRSGTLCRVFLRGDDGRRYPAGSFRYRWGDESEAMLSSALDISRTAAIGVRAGGRTFVAPVGREGATASAQLNEEDQT
ncbi:MAG TPA: anti-sigma factor [Solirubrobacterales bacterium]|jgi:hypothetical protein